jgi:hypothetical protein
MTADEVLKAFFGVFGWTYQVQLAPEQQREIQDVIRSGWANADETDRELLEYVLKLHQAISGVPEPARDSLRTVLIESFKAEFARPVATDRSRVLVAIHRAIEAQRPGATGVAPPAAPGSDDWLQLRPAAPAPPQARSPRPPPNAWAGPAEDPGDDDDPAVIQMREMRKAQAAALRSNIAKMRHDTMMAIIGNIK